MTIKNLILGSAVGKTVIQKETQLSYLPPTHSVQLNKFTTAVYNT